MTPDKREAIEAAGFRVTTVGEFLGLSDAEREEIERRVEASAKETAAATADIHARRSS